MLSSSLAITGFGTATALGNAVTSCAAQRAGMTRASPLKFALADHIAKEPVSVLGHAVGELTRGFSEVGLSVRLASLALADLLERTPLDASEIAGMAVLLNLGSGFYFRSVDDARAKDAKNGHGGPPSAQESESLAEAYAATQPLYSEVIEKSLRVLGLAAPPSARQKVSFGDQAGISALLTEAHTLLTTQQVSMCLVGGVDSLVEPRWLRACDELHLLKTPLRPVGLIPGEAGSFLLLEKSATHRRPFGFLRASESMREAGHRFSDSPPLGRGLAEVVRKCIANNAQTRNAGIISDLNGDDVRASDFGHAMVQLRQEFHPPTTIFPAVSFGDTRAASGFLATCVGLQGFARGYAPSNEWIVALAGDDGNRSALLITAPN